MLDFGHIRLQTYLDIRLCYLANAMLVTIFRFLYCTTVVEVWRHLVLSRTIHTALEYCTVCSKPAGGSGCDRKMLPGSAAEALLSL